MPNSLITLGELIDRHPRGLVIRPYQRHYVWGSVTPGTRDAVSYLTDCLVEAYNAGREYFLQGITLDGDHLVDGQQRITYLILLLRCLGHRDGFTLHYALRRAAAQCLEAAPDCDTPLPDTEDVYFMRLTLDIIRPRIADIDAQAFCQWLLQKVQLLYMPIPPGNDAVAIYKMMNGTKAPMQPTDLIKADIMRRASDIDQPAAGSWSLQSLRNRYASEWESWVRWWHAESVRSYFEGFNPHGLSLLLRLCLRRSGANLLNPLTYDEFNVAIHRDSNPSYVNARHLFMQLRNIQRRIEGDYADTDAYNRVKAIILLQTPAHAMRFMQMMWVDCSIDREQLDRYYKLSFLGLTVDEIAAGDTGEERFYELLASLSQPDVYHSEAKRDVFNLLLRLNIDEDIKLGRNFDFSVWSNRSLEHIYSKSKVWHIDERGRILDGNDNPIKIPRKRLEADTSYLRRDHIINHNGMPLTEHCIGNLVLLYGRNNAEFGNATFEQKKMLFLAPGNMSVFHSRNLLHSVCVFAGNSWTYKSIVNNYNLTLKNLRLYYGFK